MQKLDLSLEFFPPKTPAGHQNLQQTWTELNGLNPHFFSVTFGAGGTSQMSTTNTVFAIHNDIQVDTAPHISCIGMTRSSISEMLQTYKENGIKQLVVLRGDHPSGLSRVSGDFQYASELVRFIREESGEHFHISVAAYPEFHPEANSALEDIKHFKQKVDAGANLALTQFFYNSDAFFYFIDECEEHGITIPIVPGIMPIINFERLVLFSRRCGAEIPMWLFKRMEQYSDNPEAMKEFSIDVVSRLCETLRDAGVPGLHFYTLNKAGPTMEICQNISVIP